jgi:hypothetical protein
MGTKSKGIYKSRTANPVRDEIMAALDKADRTALQLAKDTGRYSETVFSHLGAMLERKEVHVCALDITRSGTPARVFRLGPRPPGFIPERIRTQRSPLRKQVPAIDALRTPPPPQHPLIAALFKGKTP